jgi:hypothetical protein
MFDGLAEAHSAQHSIRMQELARAQMAGQAGLGGLCGIGQFSLGDPYARPEGTSRPKNIKEELQNEVDEWLKDTI